MIHLPGLTRARKTKKILFYTPQDWYHMAGWALLIAGLLWSTEISNRSGYVILLVDVVIISGLSLILRTSTPFGFSSSTLKVLQEGRSKRKIGGLALHHGPWRLRPFRSPAARLKEEFPLLAAAFAVGASVGILIIGTVRDPAWQLLILLMIVLPATLLAVWQKSRTLLGIGIGGSLILLLTSVDSTAAFLYASVFCLGWLWTAWRDRHWWLYGLLVVGAYLVVVRWIASGIPDSAIAVYVLPMVLLGFCYLVSLPMVVHRRESREREVLRTILVGNFLLGEWLLIVSNPVESLGWHIALNVMPALMAVLFGGLAWYAHRRESYAKYFWWIAAVIVATQLLIYASGTWLSLALFAAAIVMAMLGMGYNSYSLRLGSLVAAGASLAVYITEVLAVEEPLAVMASNRVSLGIAYACVLPLLADWYDELPLQGREKTFRPTIVAGLYIVAALLLFLLVFFSIDGWSQSGLWLVLGVLTLTAGAVKRMGVLLQIGQVLAMAALFKLIVIDVAVVNWLQDGSIGWLVAAVLLAIILVGLFIYGRSLTIFLRRK